MFTFETSDQKEVRRFRVAQFNGRTATLRSPGSTVTGHVRSIVENKASVPAACWRSKYASVAVSRALLVATCTPAWFAAMTRRAVLTW